MMHAPGRRLLGSVGGEPPGSGEEGRLPLAPLSRWHDSPTRLFGRVDALRFGLSTGKVGKHIQLADKDLGWQVTRT